MAAFTAYRVYESYGGALCIVAVAAVRRPGGDVKLSERHLAWSCRAIVPASTVSSSPEEAVAKYKAGLREGIAARETEIAAAQANLIAADDLLVAARESEVE